MIRQTIASISLFNNIGIKKYKIGHQVSEITFSSRCIIKKDIFMGTPLIGELLKQLERTNGGWLNHWVGGLLYIAVQTWNDLKYITMRLSGYTKAVTEQESLALHNGMEYLMLSCIQETRYSKLIRLLFNVYSNNSRLISTKNNNTQNFSTHIVMRTMQVISLTGTQSHIMINYSVAPSSTGV